MERLELVLGEIGQPVKEPDELPQLLQAEGEIGGGRLEAHRGNRQIEKPVFDRGPQPEHGGGSERLDLGSWRDHPRPNRTGRRIEKGDPPMPADWRRAGGF